MLIKRILIITNDGIPVFDYEEYGRGDEALVGGLITAIMKFAEETEKESISRVMLQESQFILKKYNSLLFVLQVLEDMPGDYAEEIMDLIALTFLKRHKEDIETFRGNVSAFASFQSVCKNILQNTGIELANLLLEKREDPIAWGIFSKKGKALFVRTDSPNYNVDSFAIMQVLGKSIDKVIKSQFQTTSCVAYHINLKGNIFNSIILPYVYIIAERKIEPFSPEQLKKFKILTKNEIERKIAEKFQNEEINISVISQTNISNENAIETKEKNLLDLFQASSKGFDYLFNTETVIQILNLEKETSILVNLINRFAIISIQKHIKSEEALKKVIEFTKKVQEE